MPKHYVISDIHGMYDIYDQVNNLLGPNDVVYFLGDACDRGYANWKTFKAIYENPKWIFIKGNHEYMMEKTFEEILNEIPFGEEQLIWHMNGGNETLKEFQDNQENMSKWYYRISKLPLYEKYENPDGITFHLSHAGFTCGRGQDLLWDRSHFFDYWDEDNYPNDIVIHGHTPIEYLVEDFVLVNPKIKSWNENNPEVRMYCHGHKYNIDNGVFYSGGTVLYDLDEMEYIQIFDNKFKDMNKELKNWD